MGLSFGCDRRKNKNVESTVECKETRVEPFEKGLDDESWHSVLTAVAVENLQEKPRAPIRSISRHFSFSDATPLGKANSKINALRRLVVSLGYGESKLYSELIAISELLCEESVKMPRQHGAAVDWTAEVEKIEVDTETRRWLLSEAMGQGRNLLNQKTKTQHVSEAADLCTAAATGDVVLLQHLVAMRGDVNLGDYDHRTPLHLAASEGSLHTVRCLVVELGAKHSPEDRWGGTPLDDALRSRHESVITFLRSQGAAVGKTSNGAACASADICDAAARGDVETLRKLLMEDKKWNVNLGDYDQRTAIHLAASEGHLRTVQCLVEEFGADVNPRDRWGGTPLDDAQRSGHPVVATYLASKKGVEGNTVQLHIPYNGPGVMCDAAARGDVKQIHDLATTCSVDVNSGDYDYRTPLHLAASEGLLDTVKYLVCNLSANVNPQDRWGGTPLDDSLRSKHDEVAKFLKQFGATQGTVEREQRHVTIDTSKKKALMLDRRELSFSDETQRLVSSSLDSWDADVLHLQTASNGHALYLLSKVIFSRHGILRSCNIDPVILHRFLLEIQTTYGSNPYHNSGHAADVLLTTSLFLSKCSLSSRLQRCEKLAVFVAAIIHDYSHPGTNNSHEVKHRSKLASMHSDDAVLERHHLASAFQVLRMVDLDILNSLDFNDYRRVRHMIIEMVLHTDLARHLDFVSCLKALGISRGFVSFSANREHRAPGKTEDAWTSPFLDETLDVMTVLNTVIKFADLGHVTKPFQVHSAWTSFVTEELWLLGDKERAMDVPVSPLCDRARDVNIPKAQVGFFNFIILPFYREVADLVDPQMSPYLQLKDNLRRWLEEVEGSENASSNRAIS